MSVNMEKAGNRHVPQWDVLHIVSDLDEVLGYQIKHMHKAAWDANIGSVRKEKLTEEKYTHMRYHELWKVTPEDAHNFVLDRLTNHHLELEPVENARDNLLRIKQLAQEAGKVVKLHVLTSRSQLLTDSTTEQIDHLYPGIFEKPITLTGNPLPEAPVYGKGYYYQKVGLEERNSGLVVAKAFSDDSWKYVKDCIQTDGGLGILFGRYAWNQEDLNKLAAGELELPSNAITLHPTTIVPIRETGMPAEPLSNNVVPFPPRVVACEDWNVAGQALQNTFFPQTA